MERGSRLLLLWDVNTKRYCYLIPYLCVKTFEYCVDAFRATDTVESTSQSLFYCKPVCSVGFAVTAPIDRSLKCDPLYKWALVAASGLQQGLGLL